VNRTSRLDGFGPVWLVLLGLTLLGRALVPAGWMPVADAQGIRLTLCSGWTEPSATAAASDSHQQHADILASTEPHRAQNHVAGTRHDDHRKHQQEKKTDHTAPCTFAAQPLAGPPPLQPEIIALPPVLSSLPLATAPVSVGQGLAAPPPPSTGPPYAS